MTPMKQPVTRILLGSAAAVFLGMAAAWGQTNSHARIVRLSFAEGNVTVQRPDVADWAEAPANTPIQEGFNLSTAENSFAEVEFENSSTVRLGQLSLLEFTQLALASDGSKINRLTLYNGYATFHAAPEGQDAYEVRTPNATLSPRGNALFRADLDSSGERVEVFDGSVDVASPLGSWTLAKNSVLELSPDATQPTQLSEGITEDDWDSWVEDREGQQEAAQAGPPPSSDSSPGGGVSYGSSDLSYYGNWSYVQGFGYGWMPTVYAGWYPYSFGRWCWYPGLGYTWISGDPWGWLPYHFGWWNFINGLGWVWFPGNSGAWSPGLVTWYSGPGWIGWRPRQRPGRPTVPAPCVQGQRCGIAISTDAFQSGRPVRPEAILSVNLESGKRIEQPGILPDRQTMLPGRVMHPPAGLGSVRLTQQHPWGSAVTTSTARGGPATPAQSAVAGSSGAVERPAGSFSTHAAPGPRSGIVYDPATGQYVNDPRLPSRPAQAANELSSTQPTTNEPSSRPLPKAPEATGNRAAQPPPGISERIGPPPGSQSHTPDWYVYSSSPSNPSSTSAPRGGAAPNKGRTPSGTLYKANGGTSAAPKSTGGSSAGASSGSGGGSHGGGGPAPGGHH